MPTAKKLKSGSWNCLAYSHTEEITLPDGSAKQKRIYKSFTCDDKSLKGKKKCEMMAVEWSLNKDKTSHKPENLTFGELIDKYIEARKNVLSPNSIRDYKNIRKNHVQSLMNIKINDITQDDIQVAINELSVNHSPKTVRNTHGLISSVIGVYRPGFALKTALPKKKRVELYIPTDNDIKRLLEACRGTELELPILLAAFGTMRRGEICALTSDDINGNIVHVNKNMVLVSREGGSRWTVKTPKSYAGDRYIDYPDFVAQKFKEKKGRIVDLTPDALTDKFGKKLKQLGMPHFRFHDLRHYSASVMHALGVPDAYIMQMGGWGSDGTLKQVYRHALADKSQSMSDITKGYFTDTFDKK